MKVKELEMDSKCKRICMMFPIVFDVNIIYYIRILLKHFKIELKLMALHNFDGNKN